MEFRVNHPLLFLMAGILIAVVLGQSVYFLVKAMRRSKELGMDQTLTRSIKNNEQKSAKRSHGLMPICTGLLKFSRDKAH